ncbi:MAG TPA: cryptochrome/photolyase family protein, partial [Segetibacter sp.]
MKTLSLPAGVTLIFPHQLFPDHPALADARQIFLIEEWLFFKQYPFIKQKLVLHRASMQFYNSYLQPKYQVKYVEATNELSNIRELIKWLAAEGVTELHFAEVSDDWLNRRITKAAQTYGITTIVYPSPNFINQLSDVDAYFNEKKGYFMTDFYKWQRKKRGILLEGNDQPLGGKWSFDHENRQKIPKGVVVPDIAFPLENEWVAEARQ